MGEGKDKGEVHTYMPGGYVKNEPVKSVEKTYEFSKAKVVAVAGVLGIGAAGYLASGWLGQLDAVDRNTDVMVPDSNVSRQIEHKLEDKRVVPVETSFNQVFPNLYGESRVDALNSVEKMKNDVLKKNPSFKGMVDVVRQFEPNIRQAAGENGIPESFAMGIVLIENGGHPDLTSPVGARGPAQLLPETARSLGLRVDDEVDERIDPEKNFRAMCAYLAQMKEIFGDNLGIAGWAYHAGPGNVYAGVREYFKDTEGVDLGDAVDFESDDNQKIVKAYSEKIKSSKLNVHELLSNPAVQYEIHGILHLEDETELYVYKAVAGAEIMSE